MRQGDRGEGWEGNVVANVDGEEPAKDFILGLDIL